MKRKVEIVEIVEETVKMTKEQLVKELDENGISYFLNNYDVDDEFILENKNLFNKKDFIQNCFLSEKSIKYFIENEFLSKNDIFEMNMSTYGNLSHEFILENSDNINWTRMILYICTQTDNFDKYEDIIVEKGLFNLISSNDLPIDFIRKYKEKLDWSKLSMVKYFTENEILEFKDFYVNYSNYNPSTFEKIQIRVLQQDKIENMDISQIEDYIDNMPEEKVADEKPYDNN